MDSVEHARQYAAAASNENIGEIARSLLVHCIRGKLEEVGPRKALEVLPALEASLPPERADFLKPARLGIEVLAGKRERTLYDQPEEMRRVVREFLRWSTG